MNDDDDRPFSPGDTYGVDDGPRAYLITSGRDLQSIGEVACEFGVTARALRFYEAKGLLSPRRDGASRHYDRAERDRLELLLKAKTLGFTLAEIRKMIGPPGRRPDASTLDISRRQCFDQIKLLELRKRDLETALTELRRTYSAFYVQLARSAPQP
jgi:DNA-binding transcriptional MerR regulator